MGYTGVAELKQNKTAVYVPTNKKSRKGGEMFIKLKEWLWSILWLHKLDVGTGTPDLSRILSISS